MPSDNASALRERVTRALVNLLDQALPGADSEGRALAGRACAAMLDPHDGLVRRDLLESLMRTEPWLRHQLWLVEPVAVARRLLADQQRLLHDASTVANAPRPPYDRGTDAARRTDRAG
jgi:hypothetical protein